jgi:hypothetical protein
MAYVVGETVAETFETGALGESFSTTAAFINGIAAVWSPSFSEIGSGLYLYTHIPTQVGSYSWSGAGSLSGPLTINFEVDAAEVITPPVPGTPIGTVTLDQLVEHIALRSFDLIQATATADAGGNNSFTDVNALVEDNAFFAGMEMHVTSGPNAGQTRRIADSDYISGTLSWELALPFPITVGTNINIYNRSGMGHLYREYKQAINMVIREIAGNSMQRNAYDHASLPTFSAPSLVIDTSKLSKVCSVSYIDATGARRSLRRNRKNGWWSSNGEGTIWFTGNGLGVVANLTAPVRLHGYLKAQQLSNGSDATFIDAEWLSETAAGLLQNANPDNAGNLAPGQYLRNRADAMRGKLATPFDANCVSTS